jgi:hypothetical protein
VFGRVAEVLEESFRVVVVTLSPGMILTVLSLGVILTVLST